MDTTGSEGIVIHDSAGSSPFNRVSTLLDSDITPEAQKRVIPQLKIAVDVASNWCMFGRVRHFLQLSTFQLQSSVSIASPNKDVHIIPENQTAYSRKQHDEPQHYTSLLRCNHLLCS